MRTLVTLFLMVISASPQAATIGVEIGLHGRDSRAVTGSPLPPVSFSYASPNVGELEQNVGEREGRTYASPHALRVYAYHWSNGPPVEASAGFETDTDIRFEYTGAPTPIPYPNIEVTINPSLNVNFSRGGYTGDVAGSLGGMIRARNTCSSPTDTTCALTKSKGVFKGFSMRPDQTMEVTSPPGQETIGPLTFFANPLSAIQLMVTLFARAVGADGLFGDSSATVDAGNSLTFNPEAFFELPPGVTVNSPSLGLVDNQLPAFMTAVPLPATLVLMGPAIAMLGWRGRTQSQRHLPRIVVSP